MKKLISIPLIASLILLCGCNGYREIDRGYLVTAIGFKKTDGVIGITIEAVSSSHTNDNTSQNAVLMSEGKTITDAYHTLKSQLVKPLYFDQLGTIIIEDSAASLQAQIIDFCKDLQSVSLGIYVVSTPRLQPLFDMQSAGGMLGYDIIGLIKNYEKENKCKTYNQLYLLQRRFSSGGNTTLPSVNINGDKIVLSYRGVIK